MLVHANLTTPALSRRAVVVGGCSAACVAALAACSSYGSGGAPAPAPAPAPTGAPGAAPSGAAPSGGATGTALTSTSDVPVGGGTIFADQQVVVTQPTAGEFKAFSAICTHQGCTVSQVADGTIDCPCHGSRFAVADGSVVRGPAASPLPAKNITVEGTSIVLA
ncbi:Rieske (2Fe-2S) protein [Pseudonocardia xinjiangensis]|jgi:Rieske Fe-S protein|uniref:Cytochrome bc1 complex Rieske iron-sulfur subunit n=1 Tax=Pseudonocardia xinjiangensis TaxID=75289 RepID=A0ABX1RJI7_9PSEU|nr:Rieske (2Fe-2S) protein [Pseudonocardia xinjiangensis]